MKLPIHANIANQLPEHIRESYPNFVLFIEAYYEWLHNQNIESGISKGLIDLRDVDKTLDEFVDSIINDLGSLSKSGIATDKRLFVKHLHDLYAAKGSEKSFKLFFRLIYDIDIEVSYPSENILRSSDGNWVNQKTLTLGLISGDVKHLIESILIGQTSGATASIENVESLFINGSLKHLVTVNNRSLDLDFIAGEEVICRVGTPEESKFIVYPNLSSINVVNSGTRYSEGDIITITSTTGNGAKAIVSKVSQPTKIKLNTSYTKIGDIVTVDLGETYHLLNINDYVYLEFSSGISNGNYQVSNITSPFAFQFINNPSENISGEFVDVYNANNSGKILAITMLEHGSDYEDAEFTISSVGGYGAILSGNFGTLSNYVGKWTNNRGILSNSSTVLQDNFKYQAFSFVIKSSESIVLWRDLFKKMVHPAGMEVFSDTVIPVSGTITASQKAEYYKITSKVNVSTGLVSVNYNYNIQSTTNKDAVGYNNLIELNRIKVNIPPIKVNTQFTIDTQDSTFGAYSNYNYFGTPNFGYWGSIDDSSDDITFGSASYGSYVFSGFMVDINFKERNFKIENFYTDAEVNEMISIASRAIIVPDSTIKIYMEGVVGGVEGEGQLMFFFPW